MNWDLILILTSIMLFAYWLNYAMGSPLANKRDDVDQKAILFFIPQSLAIRRLKEFEVYKKYLTQYYEELNVTGELEQKEKTRSEHQLNMFLAGREFFTWERSFLCSICLHWWASLIVGGIFLGFDLFNARADFFQAAFTYLVLHLIIRKIA